MRTEIKLKTGRYFSRDYCENYARYRGVSPHELGAQYFKTYRNHPPHYTLAPELTEFELAAKLEGLDEEFRLRDPIFQTVAELKKYQRVVNGLANKYKVPIPAISVELDAKIGREGSKEPEGQIKILWSWGLNPLNRKKKPRRQSVRSWGPRKKYLYVTRQRENGKSIRTYR